MYAHSRRLQNGLVTPLVSSPCFVYFKIEETQLPVDDSTLESRVLDLLLLKGVHWMGTPNQALPKSGRSQSLVAVLKVEFKLTGCNAYPKQFRCVPVAIVETPILTSEFLNRRLLG